MTWTQTFVADLCEVGLMQVCPNFLPDEKTFRKEYKKPIEDGRKHEANKKDKRKMLLQSTKLKLFLGPIVHRVSALEMAKSLPPKLEVILVLRMPRALCDLYTLVVETVRALFLLAQLLFSLLTPFNLPLVQEVLCQTSPVSCL